MSLKPVSGKIESQELNDNFSYLESRYESMDKGSPKGFFETLDELETAYPNGDDGIFVVNEDGNWYYWSDAGWSAGGVYQAKGISDYSVTPKKTTFLTLSTKNLYHGILTRGIIYGSSLTVPGEFRDSPRGRSCIIEIEPNQTYTITPYGGNRRRYAVFNDYPKFGDKADKFLYVGDDVTESFTFTNEDSKYLVVYLSLEGEEVPCQVEKGEIATDYEQYYSFDGTFIKNKTIDEEKASFIKKSAKNIYHGSLAVGYLSGSHVGVGGYFEEPSPGNTGRSCIIEIEPNQTYTITPYGGNRRRYAVFNDYPKFGDKADKFLYVGDDVTESFTFTNEDSKYLVVYLSLEGEEVPCQVEKGEIATDYESYYTLDKNLIIGLLDNKNTETGNEIRKGGLISKRYPIFESFEMNYTASDQKSGADGEDFPLSEATPEEIYSLYDELVREDPEYITKVEKGTDGFGNELSYYKLTPTKTGSSNSGTGNTTDIDRIKVILAGGVHGNERLWPYVYQSFIKELINNNSEDKLLSFLRFNVDLIIVPLVCPSGYRNNSRTNERGVNINRNFSFNWEKITSGPNHSGEHPFSETETKFIKEIIDSNEDIDILLDGHNYQGGDNLLWQPLTGELTSVRDRTVMNNHIMNMSNKWKKEYEWLPQDDNRILGHITDSSLASLASYGLERGINSYTIEIRDFVDYKPDNKKFDDTIIELSLDHLVNLLGSLIMSM